MIDIKAQTDAELVKLVNQAKDELRKRSDKRKQEFLEQEATLLKSAGITEHRTVRKGRKQNVQTVAA